MSEERKKATSPGVGESLNTNTTGQLDPTDVYRRLQRTAAEYTFFSHPHGTFITTDPIQSHKTHVNTFKRLECPQNTIVLEIFRD